MWAEIVKVLASSPADLLAKLDSASDCFWRQLNDSSRDMLGEQWRSQAVAIQGGDSARLLDLMHILLPGMHHDVSQRLQ